MAMKGKMNVITKIVINNYIIEQVNSFNYLGYTVKATNNRHLEIKMNKFNLMFITIRTLNNKIRKDRKNLIKLRRSVPSEFWTITKQQEAKTELIK
jgi:hypothetical protein